MADIPSHPEQDQGGAGGLPTYEDLAAQQGPNSRFGRWRGWVEKRAAERYAELSEEERTRRKQRGWGDGYAQDEEAVSVSEHSAPSMHSQDTRWSESTVNITPPEPPSYLPTAPESSPPPAPGDVIPSSHLRRFNFGSRFLPHTTSPIRALLPIMGDRLLLIGHDEGLSVLDVFPDGDSKSASFADAQVRTVWQGEGVYQLQLLESQDADNLTPNGVVLALVGSDVQSPTSKEHDVTRSIRMYNLASLISLARWTVSQRGSTPLDLRSNWNPQQTPKKHSRGPSFSKFRAKSGDKEPECSYPVSPKDSGTPPLRRGDTTLSVDSSWDVVDDLPLRWATDYVPLASSGSRLVNCSVLFFELKKNDNNITYKGVSVLCVATKSSIFIYETPKGERAFRFVKEFYTPIQPRSISFVQQRVSSDTVVARSVSASTQGSRFTEHENRRFSLRPSLDTQRDRQRQSSTSPIPDYGNQPSLFVVFEKKAGLIRLADSAVGEVELFDDGSAKDLSLSTSPRRQKASFEAIGFSKYGKGYWLPPSYEEIPLVDPSFPNANGYHGEPAIQSIYLLTRGKQTHILPFPLPTPLSSIPPLAVLNWLSTPSQLCHRVCFPPDEPPFLQVIGLGELGVEVQEIPLPLSSKGKGKGRARELASAQLDVGGDAGFLCQGGLWHKSLQYLSRSDSFMSIDSVSTYRPGKRDSELGFYAWCRRGLEDWRVFWLGGTEKVIEPID